MPHPKKKKGAAKPSSGKASKPTFLNFQGYSMTKCRFRKEVMKDCYTPYKYHQETVAGKFSGLFCKDCLLQPCFVLVKNVQINKDADALHESKLGDPEYLDSCKDKKNEIMNKEMKEKVMKGIFEGIFSKRYVKKFGVPLCAIRSVDRSLPGKKPMTKEEKSLARNKIWQQIKEERIEKRKALAARKAEGLLDSDSDSSGSSFADPGYYLDRCRELGV